MNRFIDIIEKANSASLHPVWYPPGGNSVLSFIFSQLGTSITYYSASKTAVLPEKSDPVKVVNLLSRSNLRYPQSQISGHLCGVYPLKLTLIMMALAAFIDKTGFTLGTAIEKYLLKGAQSLITFAVAFMAVNANLMSDAGPTSLAIRRGHFPRHGGILSLG